MLNRIETSSTGFHGMLGASASMKQVFEQLTRVARTEFNVLLRGESGTGKELAARAIHRMGPRNGRPFLAVNCATFTSEMLASQLFGHVKGAFTGAVHKREGLFEAADSGTLFLDEVAEIPLDLQGRLLRVLQDGTYQPLGATRTRAVDVRIISATHVSLRELVEHRRYREDLMYRVRVVIVRMPPLRERGDDLGLLLWRMIDTLNATQERSIRSVSKSAAEALRAYAWPGNVRELQNVLRSAYALGRGPELTLDDLTPEVRGEAWPGASSEPVLDTLAAAERRRLLALHAEHGGRRHAMAEAMGWSRSTLYRRLREHGLV
ncbi:MAG: sigma-54 interaction domain-containing protein [Myxococcota bacterium]